MRNLKIILTGILALAAGTVHSQYYSDRPLEMTFEQSDFFFSPSFLNPMGAANFGAASVLTSDHPLNALQRNPANLLFTANDTLPSNYLYLDLRNTRDIVKDGYGIWPGMYRYSGAGWGYYQTSRRNELTPVISLAYLTQLPVMNNSVAMGATYQLVNQAERYYAVPHDIYRNLAGKTVDGTAYMGMENYTITDRFSGSDDMYHEGHIINLFLSWRISDDLEIGIKTGRFIFDREGSLGSNNLWNQNINYQSHWKSHEDRSQSYGHWDYSLGINYLARNNNKLGLYAGYLNGNVSQNMSRDDESVSKYGQRDNSDWSDYQSWHKSSQAWDHDGNTYYSGIQWERPSGDKPGFRLMYNFSRTSQDIGLNSNIESESDNEYYYSGSNNISSSEGFSNMHDFRVGSGNRTITNNRFDAALLWDLQENQSLSIGAIFGVRNQSTKTGEAVDAFSETYYLHHYENNSASNTYEFYQKTIEDKTILWEFDTRLRSVQIPVIYEFDITRRIEALLGINRIMNFWTIENSTLVLYDYRERVNNNQTLIEQNTGERITEPRERLSVITTSFLGGITFSPSEVFSVQFMASPGFEKNSLLDENRVGMQLWIGMNLKL